MESKKELKKHTAAIHCANTLTLLQRKISNALLFHAYHELPTKAEHDITVKQLCNHIGYAGNNHSVIKDALRGLITTLVEWNVTETDNDIEDWTASTVLASVRIRGSLCRYAYSPRMKELLYSPSMYGKINLIVQAKFQSSYGLALYENCIRYRELPHTKWLELEAFRKLMGVPNSKYVVFSDLKKRVIDKSVEEVNKYSDLRVSYQLQKMGRQVSKIRFILDKKEKRARIGRVGESKQNPSQGLVKTLQNDFNFNSAVIADLIRKYPEEYLEKKIQSLKLKKSSSNIRNLGGYLISSLKKNYEESTLSNRNNKLSLSIVEDQDSVESMDKSWEEGLVLLKIDLQHWEKQLEQMRNSSNSTSIASLESIIRNCKEKLKRHKEGRGYVSEDS